MTYKDCLSIREMTLACEDGKNFAGAQFHHSQVVTCRTVRTVQVVS